MPETKMLNGKQVWFRQCSVCGWQRTIVVPETPELKAVARLKLEGAQEEHAKQTRHPW